MSSGEEELVRETRDIYNMKNIGRDKDGAFRQGCAAAWTPRPTCISSRSSTACVCTSSSGARRCCLATCLDPDRRQGTTAPFQCGEAVPDATKLNATDPYPQQYWDVGGKVAVAVIRGGPSPESTLGCGRSNWDGVSQRGTIQENLETGNPETPGSP